MKNLATIQIIDKIVPIPGADKIEMAQILGWQCVIAKEAGFKEGDKVIYNQIDTLLPFHESYAFLEKGSPFKEYGPEYGEGIKPGVKYTRLKTARFLGQVSQGLVLKPSEFGIENPEVDMDVTDIVGTVKYEKPVPISMAGSMKGNFPSNVFKTDESNGQNSIKSLAAFDGKEVYETLKIDGTSATYIYRLDTDIFSIASRNNEMLVEGDSIYALIAKQLNIAENLKAYCIKVGKSLAIQGEIAGPRINGNNLGLTTCIFRLFTVQDVSDANSPAVYLGYNDLKAVADACALTMVPILKEPYIFKFEEDTVKRLVEEASELKYETGKPAEGKVIRAVDEVAAGLPPRGLARWSFKILNNKYKEN